MIKPLTDTIPTSRAWREGRRVYVVCGYGSRLNGALRDLGAHWDAEVMPPGATRPGALWIGSGKADQVAALVAEHEERVAEVTATKQAATTAGLWVAIPYAQAGVRDLAKTLGARWDRDRKQWAMPTREAHDQVVEALNAAQAATRAAAPVMAAQPKAAPAPVDPAAVAAAAGRTVIGEVKAWREQRAGYRTGATARAEAYRPGDIIRGTRGGRYLVVEVVDVWFVGEDLGSSCWHNEIGDEAHWHWSYRVVRVAPTAVEAAADAAEAAVAADTDEIRAAVQAVRAQQHVVTDAGARETWTDVEGPTVVEDGSGPSSTRYVLDGDRVLVQHPGWYDDYRRTEWETRVPAVVDRFRAVVERGPRRRGLYRVEVPGA